MNDKIGIIYKLCCKDTNVTDIYVGSTEDYRLRKLKHKSNTNNTNSEKYNLSVYKCIRKNGGWNNWQMIQLEEIKFKDRFELHTRERHFIENTNATLNVCIPTRTTKEYNEYYRNEHYEKINEKFTCDCGGRYTYKHKSEHYKSKKHQLYISTI